MSPQQMCRPVCLALAVSVGRVNARDEMVLAEEAIMTEMLEAGAVGMDVGGVMIGVALLEATTAVTVTTMMMKI